MAKRREYGPAEGSQRMRGLTEAAKELLLEEQIAKLPMNATLRHIYSNRLVPTVQMYLWLNYLGAVRNLNELQEMPEDYAEVMDLVEGGFLVDTQSQKVN